MAEKNTSTHEEHDNDGQSHRSEAYGSARNTFEALGMEEKAMFLVESAVATVVGGLQRFGEQMNETFREACDAEEEEAAHAEDTEADSGAAKSEAKKSAKGKATAKKPATKKAGSTKKSGAAGKKATDKES